MSLMNSSLYYWNQSQESFFAFRDSNYRNHNVENEMYMWLFLYSMSKLGEEES